jgi:predicted flap endonuclease-1-like 5' DNA nuclease
MNILVSGLFSTAESYGKGTAMTEIIIMLLVAFILGYLLRYFLSKDKQDETDWKEKYDLLNKQYQSLLDENQKLTDENENLKSELANCNKKQEKLTFASDVSQKPARKDNLKKIEGIGPKIEQLLYAEAIFTWDDLAKTEVSVIQAILDKAGSRYKMHNPESWPFQAELAAKGKWDELNKWQDEHKGGRF